MQVTEHHAAVQQNGRHNLQQLDHLKHTYQLALTDVEVCSEKLEQEKATQQLLQQKIQDYRANLQQLGAHMEELKREQQDAINHVSCHTLNI